MLGEKNHIKSNETKVEIGSTDQADVVYPEAQEHIYGLGEPTEEAWLDFLTAALSTMLESYDSQNAWLEAIPSGFQNRASELRQTLKDDLLEKIVTEIMAFKNSQGG